MRQQNNMPMIDVKYVDLNTAKSRVIKGEEVSSESITEQTGYIPPQVQIENMINAGRRLQEARDSEFDFNSEEEIDEEAYDPTRSGNFDLADATQAQFEVTERLSKASQTAQKPSGGDSVSSEGVTVPPPDKEA